jgi:hypothetical protein
MASSEPALVQSQEPDLHSVARALPGLLIMHRAPSYMCACCVPAVVAPGMLVCVLCMHKSQFCGHEKIEQHLLLPQMPSLFCAATEAARSPAWLFWMRIIMRGEA